MWNPQVAGEFAKDVDNSSSAAAREWNPRLEVSWVCKRSQYSCKMGMATISGSRVCCRMEKTTLASFSTSFCSKKSPQSSQSLQFSTRHHPIIKTGHVGLPLSTRGKSLTASMHDREANVVPQPDSFAANRWIPFCTKDSTKNYRCCRPYNGGVHRCCFKDIAIVLYVERMHYLTFGKSRFCTLVKNFVNNSLGHMAFMFWMRWMCVNVWFALRNFRRWA